MNIKPDMPAFTLAELLAMPVHPMAARFPMLPADELQTLANDIKQNGLRHPILIGPVCINPDREDGVDPILDTHVLDGRNRLAACEIAEIEPRTEEFVGDEDQIAALILSENVERRNLTLGQRIMARAILTKEVKQGSRTDLTFPNSGKLDKAETNALSQCRFILRKEPAIAQSVLNGSMSLNEAHIQAKNTGTEEQKKAAEEAARQAALDDLRRRYPDIARKVEADDDWGLKAGLAEAADRDERSRQQRQTVFNAVKQAIESLAILAFEQDADRSVVELIKTYPDEFAAVNRLGSEYLAERMVHADSGAAALTIIIKYLEEQDHE